VSKARIDHKSSPTVKTDVPLKLIHTDIVGPFKTHSGINGELYMCSFIDNATRGSFLYLLNKRTEFLDVLKELESTVERDFDTQIGSFKSDLVLVK
jgi:hypothetical protein